MKAFKIVRARATNIPSNRDEIRMAFEQAVKNLEPGFKFFVPKSMVRERAKRGGNTPVQSPIAKRVSMTCKRLGIHGTRFNYEVTSKGYHITRVR